MTDVFSYTGAERAAIPVWAVFIRTAVSVTRTPAVRWSSRSSMTMPIVFPMGLPWSAKEKRTIAVSDLSIARGVKSYLVFMRMSPVFHRALARVQEGTDSVRRYGYVDTLGQVVIPLKYDYARDFSEGMAVVAKGEWSGKSGYGKRDFEFTGKYGFIDRRGNEVIAPIYDGAADFSEVLAAVGQMGKYYVRWGFIDAAGTLVIPCKYYEVSSFRNGRAVVCIVSGGALKYGSIDRNGREILPCIYDWVQHTPFGTTWVGEGEDFASRACTLLDVSGKPLIDYKVYQVNPSGKFGHASAAVPDSTGLLRFGVLDGRGRVIVPFEYDDITIFSEWDSAAAAYVERGIAEVKGKKYPFALRRGE